MELSYILKLRNALKPELRHMPLFQNGSAIIVENKEKEIPLNEVSTKETDFGVDFVCRREDGSYVTSRTLQNVSNAVHKELDIPGYDTYSLRHTHGTMLIENGADMVYVQRRLGHKNINVTMNIYTNHLTPIIKSRNNITLNNMY